MKNRTVNPLEAERTEFGLIAWLEQTRIVLPLKGVECSFHVCGDVLSVEIDQIFHQNNSQPLDCTYTFPLPASAAVYRCEMHVNGRVIRAKVEERERARELAREKKAAGYRTALVEMERDNLFTLSLGNVQPQDLVVIRFAYFQTLRRLADWTSFSVPFCPGVRYIPGTPLLRGSKGRGVVDDTDQVPDASRISPPRMDRLHTDAAYLSIQGVVENPVDQFKDISSPSHPVLVKPGKPSSEVRLAERAAVPDCDFILRWTEVPMEQLKPVGWVSNSRDGSFALIRLRAPMNVSTVDSYSQDVYFLIDRSGSMQGLKWQKAVEAFCEFLKGLGGSDRVWATFFESSFRDLAGKPLPPTELLSDASVKALEALGTAGGTELLPALNHVLEQVPLHSANRTASLVIITDGQVGNEAEILRCLRRNGNLRVHVFGIDVAINDGFLQKLAAQNHGTSCLLSPRDDIVGAVSRLGDRLRRPVLTGICVPAGWELAGQELPDLHAGEVLSLPLRRANHPEEQKRPLSIQAKLPDGTLTRYDFGLVGTDTPSLRLLWARQRIDFLLAGERSQDAISLAKEHNIVCEGAAFVAWDEAEKVQISTREIYQPAMETRFVAAACAPRGLVMGDSDTSLMEKSDLGTFRAFARFSADRKAAAGISGMSNDPQAPLIPSQNPPPEIHQRSVELRRHPMFQTPASARLADVLVAWAESNPHEIEKRWTKIDLLLKRLNLLGQTSNCLSAEQLQLLRRWIEDHVEEPFKTSVLSGVGLLEQEHKEWRAIGSAIGSANNAA
jgi:Ca-activated chloride channel family protein